ncbi:uncharacterized protein LOC143246145 isoform X2 [Tachypleus tridentatus]|uniref:uncharacterized protein LOC143246145 isoform X2 n=1 Tax=Tachypleus tridentatus TaxID=6853 RepID=UPI003FCF8648
MANTLFIQLDEILDEATGKPVQELGSDSKQADEESSASHRQKSSVSRHGRREVPAPRYIAGKGTVSFWKNFEYEQQGRPFIRVSHDVNMEEVAEVVSQDWNLSNPRIVLVIVSNVVF